MITSWQKDAVQETFVQVASLYGKRRTAGGDCHETLSDYDYKTYAAIDLYREETGYKAGKSIWMNFQKKQTLTYMAPEEHGVLDILKNLPPKYRDIFLLKYSLVWKTGRLPRCTPDFGKGTIRQRIARGKRLIEKELEKIKKGEIPNESNGRMAL